MKEERVNMHSGLVNSDPVAEKPRQSCAKDFKAGWTLLARQVRKGAGTYLVPPDIQLKRTVG